MSAPKLISPMLDNFAMGDPICDHNGVRCCPAMDNIENNKYLVKIISIPSSATQLDALLLSGAYSSAEDAMSYFKTLADDIIEEANVLQKLSQLEGFLAFDDHQLVPMDSEPGYDVYLLSTYKKTLAKILRNGPMTHLAAINLGLDLCAALAVCRRLGYLFVDLKPENIFLNSDNSFKIGDIGFIKLDSLKYASLADRYRSEYTAPEIVDAFSSINTTVDVYALGLILYQVFNGGQLPNAEIRSSNERFPAPDYADYEMAEIILKACDPDPSNRWQDPIEMGQALVSYMQRNGANDTLITPVSNLDAVVETSPFEQEDIVEGELTVSDAENDIEIDVNSPGLPDNVACDEEKESENTDSDLYSVDDEGNLSFLDTDDPDPAFEDENLEEIDYDEVSDEVSDILTQVDKLVSHPAPEPVVAPDPVDVQLPDPVEENTVEESVIADQTESVESSDAEEIPSDESIAGDTLDTAEAEENTPKYTTNWLRNTFIAILLLAVAALGFLFYTRYYLQPIESIVLEEHDNGDLTVYVSSEIDESKLKVICSDTYGNQSSHLIVNGKTTITGLAPNSAYTVEVVIDGFHRLTGDTSTAFTTPVQTNIVQFIAVTGAENGSVILNFTVDGPDAKQWKVTYSADGQQGQSATFSGHMYTISGLSVGTTYQFTLSPVEALNLTGTNEVTYTASNVIKAANLQITSCKDGVLTATWSSPADVSVDSWTVRCYDDKDFDKTIVVNEATASFDGVDSGTAYTVEVTASGMSVSERAYAPANSINVSDFKVAELTSNSMKLSWTCNEDMSDNGWQLIYTADGSAAQELVCSTDNTATLNNIVPSAQYTFTLQTNSGSAVLGGQLIYKTADAKAFSKYGVTAENMNFRMCKTPSKKNWDRYDLSDSDYTTSFESGSKASFLVNLDHKYKVSTDSITTLYVIRDSKDNIVSVASTTNTWKQMWYRSYCELNIPALPQAAGEYSISVYFDGSLAEQQKFSIR